jgi:probable F420-dependent oxidoreductase
MKFFVTLPFDRMDENAGEFMTMEAVRQVGAAAERAGFHAAAVTDHPCPTGRWLDHGGHIAQDPFVMLSLLAAATTRLRLLTGILVLPYRNPFIVARQIASLDHFSGGRVEIGLGAGYLKGEYKALGVDFEARNELMDEYLRALKASLTGEEFTFEGSGYQALGNRILPGPVQQPHPPLLVGGNSRRAIRRAAELGDAWYPFFTPSAILSATARTAQMSSEEDLTAGIAYLREHSAAISRSVPPYVVTGAIAMPGEDWTPQLIVERAGRFAEQSVVMTGMHIKGDSLAEWCDNAERFGEAVIARLSPA